MHEGNTPSSPARRAPIMALAALLAGCGGSGVGGGQSPDPVVLDFPIAYVGRPLPRNEDGELQENDLREPVRFLAGGDVYLRERAAAGAAERNLTGAITGGAGDARDLSASFDGSRILFALRRPLIEDADDEDQPTWNIWEYDLANDRLRRLIPSDLTAESGHDIAPRYLPDGRIVFASTRQSRSRALLLDEGKPQYTAQADNGEPAFMLHVMDASGGNIEQISFNPGQDLHPEVLADGRITFTRWDTEGGAQGMHLYRAAPDGTGLELLYGARSHDTGSGGATVQFFQPRTLPGGELLSLVRPFTGTAWGGDLVAVDTAAFVEVGQPTATHAGLATPGQRRAVSLDVRTGEAPSPGGRFAAVDPMDDGTGRLLVSWSQCRLMDGGRIVPCTGDNLGDELPEAPPLYGIWVLDPRDGTQRPVVRPREEWMYSDVAVAAPRPRPPLVLGITDDQALADDGVGVLHIRSVYDVDGMDTAVPDLATVSNPALTPADARPARFLRVVKAVSQPDDDVRDVPGSAFGAARGLGMREIVAYAPVAPDGSVRLQVPADVPLAVEVLDARGRRISPRHGDWLQLRPGEVRQCQGCHDPASGLSHGRADAFTSIHPGAAGGAPFPGTDPAQNLIPLAGETMAQTLTGEQPDTLKPSVDLVFEDPWTDPAARTPDPGFRLGYADLGTPAPVDPACVSAWSAGCRIVIHYEEHIQPLWELNPRPMLDAAGVQVTDPDGNTANDCLGCHSPTGAAGAARIPAGSRQLDLSGTDSSDEPDHLTGYRELLFRDNEQTIDPATGNLVDVVVPVLDAAGNQVFETDENGELIVDAEGNPIPVTRNVPVAPPLSSAGANASPAFFEVFAAGGSHAGWLTPAELRLVSEWVDLGGQYFNDPFAAPED